MKQRMSSVAERVRYALFRKLAIVMSPQVLGYILGDALATVIVCQWASWPAQTATVSLTAKRAHRVVKHTPYIARSSRVEMFLALAFSTLALVGVIAFGENFWKTQVLLIVLVGTLIPLGVLVALRRNITSPRKVECDFLLAFPIAFGIIMMIAGFADWQNAPLDQKWFMGTFAFLVHGFMTEECTKHFRKWPIEAFKAISEDPLFEKARPA